MNRRHFLNQSTGCTAHIYALSCLGGGAFAKRAFAAQDGRKVVAKEKWGRLEGLGEGVWALISTPFDTKDFTTVCNGGIVAGKTGVLAIEAMMQPAGAKWLAEQAVALTGRKPTDVVMTHYHRDHTAGHPGYIFDGKGPKMWLTEPTQKGAEESFAEADSAPPEFLGVERVGTDKPLVIDLGGRAVKVVPRKGHTSSDLTIEVSDPKVVWTGDLFFNRMFPNYGDSQPDLLAGYAAEMTRLDKEVVIVPGHGPLADQSAVQLYQGFLRVVEEAAVKAHESGNPPEKSAEQFKLPESMDEWLIWSPENVKKAFAAWYRVLDAKK